MAKLRTRSGKEATPGDTPWEQKAHSSLTPLKEPGVRVQCGSRGEETSKPVSPPLRPNSQRQDTTGSPNESSGRQASSKRKTETVRDSKQSTAEDSWRQKALKALNPNGMARITPSMIHGGSSRSRLGRTCSCFGANVFRCLALAGAQIDLEEEMKLIKDSLFDSRSLITSQLYKRLSYLHNKTNKLETVDIESEYYLVALEAAEDLFNYVYVEKDVRVTGENFLMLMDIRKRKEISKCLDRDLERCFMLHREITLAVGGWPCACMAGGSIRCANFCFRSQCKYTCETH
mmetsp:Transcript_29025/g.70797  ORF Transcript_29025/g.70797 Transcript_29025/m.70797 type:complete len:289 (-) Transcript_29025:66-932(-)